ncbi:hypothetical protein YC2023_039234 [Brassica napus]
MGNCLRHEMYWAGEDWDDLITEDEEHHHHQSSKTSIEASSTVFVARDSKSSDLSHHEIKIRLTKKQFQDLLSNVNVHDLTTGSDLDRKTEEGNQHRLWRPVLKSIRETRQHLMVTYEVNPSFNTN